MDKAGEKFNLLQGVKQKDPISQQLFILVMEEIIYKMKDNYGVNINGRKLFNLCFADDITLETETLDEAQALIEELIKHSRQTGVQIITTKIMTNSVELKTKLNTSKNKTT